MKIRAYLTRYRETRDSNGKTEQIPDSREPVMIELDENDLVSLLSSLNLTNKRPKKKKGLNSWEFERA